MLKRNKSILLLGSLLLFTTLSAEARVNFNIDLAIATAPPPPANVVMMAPQGYSNCYVTPGAWFNGVWVPPHQECTYPTPDGGNSLWVSGYWGCLAVGPGGGCGRWKWYGHHWRGPQVGYNNHYYGRHYQRRHW